MGYYIGLDLGQSKDYTALAVLEVVPPPPVEVIEGRVVKHVPSKERPALHIRHLERFSLNTRYPAIVAAVGDRVRALTRGKERPTLVLDKTGVGAPVADLFTDAGLAPVAITITASGEPTRVPGGFNVPKRDLVSVVQATLQTKRLRFAEALPDVHTLTQELLNFQYKITAQGNDIYGAWRQEAHDDLVLAVSLAVWVAERIGNVAPWTAETMQAFARRNAV